MTKRANLLLLALAMVLALITSIAIVRAFAKVKESHSSVPMISIVMVVRNVPEHSVVTADDVQMRSIPVSAESTNAVTTLSDVVGKYSASTWFVGQQVIQPMILDSLAPASFPLTIPNGKRAFTVSDDAVLGVDHLISVGDYVDVLTTTASSSAGAHDSNGIVTALQNIMVLAVDNPPSNTGSQASAGSGSGQPTTAGGGSDTITLAVTPKQAQILDAAIQFGQIHLVLRHPGDHAKAQLTRLSASAMGS